MMPVPPECLGGQAGALPPRARRSTTSRSRSRLRLVCANFERNGCAFQIGGREDVRSAETGAQCRCPRRDRAPPHARVPNERRRRRGRCFPVAHRPPPHTVWALFKRRVPQLAPGGARNHGSTSFLDCRRHACARQCSGWQVAAASGALGATILLCSLHRRNCRCVPCRRCRSGRSMHVHVKGMTVIWK